MAHHKSALKRIQLSAKQRERNRQYKSQMKTAMKHVLSAETQEAASTALVNAYSVIDKLAIKGIIRKNTAANKKSRLARHVNRIA